MDAPGFYDDPAFLAAEQADPTFLNRYARFAQQRPRDEEYEARVRRVVPQIAGILHRELEAEGRLGACVDMSMVLSRILDAEHIWNYEVKGSLTLTFPRSVRRNPIYFWPIDTGETRDGQVWVSAPPYDVVDVTIRQQPYPNSTMREILAPYVLLDSINSVEPTVDDIVSADVQMIVRRENGFIPPDLHFHLNPYLRDVFAAFPANERRVGRVRMRYVPCAFGASDQRSPGPCARPRHSWDTIRNQGGRQPSWPEDILGGAVRYGRTGARLNGPHPSCVSPPFA